MQIRFPLTSRSTKFQAIVEFLRRPTRSTLSHHKSYRFGRQGAKKHRQWELMPIVGAHSTGLFFRKWLFHDFLCLRQSSSWWFLWVWVNAPIRLRVMCTDEQKESPRTRAKLGSRSLPPPHHTRINGVLISNWKYHEATHTTPAPDLISCETF